MRKVAPAILLAISLPVALAAQEAKPPAALPDPIQLLQRALANEKKMASEQERYECRQTDWSAETDKNGKIKHQDTEVKEGFFVNGQQIERTLQKNGKDLTADETRKEDDRVMKEAVKYSDKSKADKQAAKDYQQTVDMLSAMMLSNGHREQVNGRSVLFYDVVPSPHFQPKNLTQHFASVMAGTMSLDEQTGEAMDLNIRSVQDLKVAGGLVATLHKGFWLHVHQSPQGDGVWLTDLAEGSGDARALLFVHPYFQFKETTGDCHLYNATAQQVGQVTVVKK